MTQAAKPMPDLKGQNVLVMDGEQGMGLQAALALGQAGARVMLAGDHADQLEEAVQDLQALGLDARWVKVRGAQTAELQRLVDQTLERMGDIHVLVSAIRLHLEQSDWHQSLEKALHAGFDLGHCVVTGGMSDLGHGCVICLMEFNAPRIQRIDGSLRRAISLAEGAVKKWATLWQVHGVRVNAVCICPDSQTKDTSESIEAAVSFFASDTGEQITGQCLTLDC